MAIWDTIGGILKKPGVLPTIGAGAAGAIGSAGSTSTSMPIEPAGYKGIGDLLRQRATARLSTPFDTAGYEARGIGNVNNAYEGAGMALGNKLTASGLADSPIAGAAQGKFEATRAGSIADFLNTVPEVQRQAEMQDFGQVADFYGNSLGRSQQTSGTGGWQGAAGGVAEMLGQLYGQGVLGGKGTPGGGGFPPGKVWGDGTPDSPMGNGQVLGGIFGGGMPGMPGAPEFPGGLPGLAKDFGPAGGGAGQGLTGPIGKAAGAAGGGVGGALSSIGTLGGLVPLAAGIPIIGAGLAIAGKLFINSQAHRQADKLTGEGGIQSNLNADLKTLADSVIRGEISQQQADQVRQQTFKAYADEALKFAAGGGDKATVVSQMLSSYDWDPALRDIAAQYRAKLGGSNV